MSSKNRIFLAIGGAGCAVSPTVLAHKNAGYEVIVLGNLFYEYREIIDNILEVELVVANSGGRAVLARLLTTHEIDAVRHFAAILTKS